MVYQSTSTRSNQVYGVTALSRTDAWAVGGMAGSGGVSQDEPLALQWNGQRWKPVTVPGAAGYYLPDVAASAETDLWVFAVPANGGDAKAVRWDGTRWQDIPLPAGVYPDDVAVLKPTDAWVLGPQQPCTGSGTSQVCPTTLYHWDGSTWSPFTLPIVVDELSGSALAASGPNHVWVAGASHPCVASPCSYRVKVYSWNGSTWGKAPGFPRVDSYYLPGPQRGTQRVGRHLVHDQHRAPWPPVALEREHLEHDRRPAQPDGADGDADGDRRPQRGVDGTVGPVDRYPLARRNPERGFRVSASGTRPRPRDDHTLGRRIGAAKPDRAHLRQRDLRLSQSALAPPVAQPIPVPVRSRTRSEPSTLTSVNAPEASARQ